MPKKAHRTYTENFQSEKQRRPKAFTTIKSDITSMFWKL